MTHAVAKEVIDRLVKSGSDVSSIVELVRPEMAPDEFKAYVRHVGEVLGAIQLDLLVPIVKVHPDLDPDK